MQNTITNLEDARRIAIELGLLSEEFDRIVEILGGRIPSYTELGIFSVMWSEHCSYKQHRDDKNAASLWWAFTRRCR